MQPRSNRVSKSRPSRELPVRDLKPYGMCKYIICAATGCSYRTAAVAIIDYNNITGTYAKMSLPVTVTLIVAVLS